MIVQILCDICKRHYYGTEEERDGLEKCICPDCLNDLNEE